MPGIRNESTAYCLTASLLYVQSVSVSQAESDDDVLKKMQNADEVMGIELRVKEVPQVLSKLKHINSLNLQFTDDVVLPEWLDDITIDHFSISGKMTKDEKEYIQSRFPNAHISNY